MKQFQSTQAVLKKYRYVIINLPLVLQQDLEPLLESSFLEDRLRKYIINRFSELNNASSRENYLWRMQNWKNEINQIGGVIERSIDQLKNTLTILINRKLNDVSTKQTFTEAELLRIRRWLDKKVTLQFFTSIYKWSSETLVTYAKGGFNGLYQKCLEKIATLPEYYQVKTKEWVDRIYHSPGDIKILTLANFCDIPSDILDTLSFLSLDPAAESECKKEHPSSNSNSASKVTNFALQTTTTPKSQKNTLSNVTVFDFMLWNRSDSPVDEQSSNKENLFSSSVQPRVSTSEGTEGDTSIKVDIKVKQLPEALSQLAI